MGRMGLYRALVTTLVLWLVLLAVGGACQEYDPEVVAHEAKHAVVAALLEVPFDYVQAFPCVVVTAGCLGCKTLGCTMISSERMLKQHGGEITHADLFDLLAVLLAPYTTYPGDDVRDGMLATGLARRGFYSYQVPFIEAGVMGMAKWILRVNPTEYAIVRAHLSAKGYLTEAEVLKLITDYWATQKKARDPDHLRTLR